MPTIVKETGTGSSTSNSYEDVAGADAFHESNSHGSSWADLSADDKAKALITATRLLDQHWQWNGYKLLRTQALQWPRIEVPDPDAHAQVFPRQFRQQIYLPQDEVPAAIVRATAQLALTVSSENREVEADGKGISSFTLDDVMSVTFDQKTRAEIVPEWLTAELSKYGRAILSRSGTVKLVRA